MKRCVLIAWLCLLLALLPPFLVCRPRAAAPVSPSMSAPETATPAPATPAPSPVSAPTPEAREAETVPPSSTPAPLLPPAPEAEAEEEEAEEMSFAPATPSPAPDGAAVAAFAREDVVKPGADAGVSLSVLGAEGVRETTLAAYLPGVLAGEMPASFQPEALRAQAVAARTYILCRLREGCAAHPEAAVCADAGCCEAWLSPAELRERWGADYERYAAKIAAAVADTDGVYLRWGDAPIHACFHSSSAGETEDAAAVWGGQFPYLVSVLSPETTADVPNYLSSSRWESEAFRERLLARFPEAALTGEPAAWVESPVLDESGRVASITVGGVTLSGTQLREAFSLRSTAFSLWWTGRDFLFTVTGYGHGVGMSQYGAHVMAAHGSAWDEILSHYYPGTELSSLG